MADAGITELVQERCGLGIGTVILDDDLEVLVRLRDRGRESVPERIRASQCRNDDRELRHREGLMPMFGWPANSPVKRQDRLEDPLVTVH